MVGSYDGRYGYSFSASKVRRSWCRLAAWTGLHRRLRIAASDVSVTSEAPRSSTIINVFPARLKACFPLGASEISLVLAFGTGGSGTNILARIAHYSFGTLRLKDGMDVFAQLKHVSLVSGSEAPSRAPEASRSTGDSTQASVACLKLANKRTEMASHGPSSQSSAVWNMISIAYSDLARTLARSIGCLIDPIQEDAQCDGHTPSSRAHSIETHGEGLSATVGGRIRLPYLEWQANLLTDQHSALVGRAVLQ